MKTLSRLVPVFSAAALAVLVLAGFQPDITYRILPGSKLSFEGTTTLQGWECSANAVSGELVVAAPEKGELRGVSVSIPVKELDCGKKVMNNRMHGLLKEKDNPRITFTLKEAKTAAAPGANGAFELHTTGDLTIAGKTRAVQMKVNGVREADGRLRFTGTQPLYMTHFDVEPPKFLNITTGDSISVSFDIVAAPR